MENATAALVISVVSLVVSVIVGGWQVLRYALEGGRLAVEIRKGWLSDGSLQEAPIRKATPDAQLVIQPPRLHIEVIVLNVSNRGRTAVTISEPSLDLSRSRQGWRRFALWRRWWWYRHTMSPALLEWSDAESEYRKRLEPFDSVKFLLDPHPALRITRDRPRSTRIRGSVKVAGKRFRKRSPLRTSLVAEPGQSSLTGQTFTHAQVAWQVAKQHADSDFPPGLVSIRVGRAADQGKPMGWRSLAQILRDGPSKYMATSLAVAINGRMVWHGLASGHPEDDIPDDDDDA
jgi:hypothetical protein